MERLGRKKQLKLIRLGHPARLLESIQKFSLESIVMESHQDVKNALRDDLDECFVSFACLRMFLNEGNFFEDQIEKTNDRKK